MDNKKWYKRISTCFWFLLATLPWWFGLLIVIVKYFIHFDGVTDYDSIASFFNSNTINSSYISLSSTFYGYIPSYLRVVFENLCDSFSISSTYKSVLSVFTAWFCWVYFIELMVDFVVWLPRLCHSFMERWCRD